MRPAVLATVAQLAGFDEIIDTRSESEFAADHVSGAVNCPVLNDEERARIGTIYKQCSPFEARKLGAALASGNISRHLRERFLDRPRAWRPLVYCWRGGQRSAAFAHVLSEIGWETGRLEGGYRAYRRAVLADLQSLPGVFAWRVVCGLTGAGKSRLLQELRAAGAQVLDLEALAAHRGSLLGDLPGEPQPSQKLFESRLWSELKRFSPERPLYVEAESRRIGSLGVPESLIAAMWQARCVLLEAPVGCRVEHLKREYRHFIEHPELLIATLEALVPLHGHATVEKWKDSARAGAWDELTASLLVQHYDPAYTRAIMKHYPALAQAVKLELADASDEAFGALTRECLARG